MNPAPTKFAGGVLELKWHPRYMIRGLGLSSTLSGPRKPWNVPVMAEDRYAKKKNKKNILIKDSWESFSSRIFGGG